MRPPLLIALVSLALLAAACSGTDDEATAPTVAESTTAAVEAEGDAPDDAEAAPEQTTSSTEATTTTEAPTTTEPPTTEAPTTTEAVSTVRVTSAEEAGQLVIDQLEAVGAYVRDGIIGDGARIADLEAALETWSPGANVDVDATHNCLVEGFVAAKALLAEDAIYELNAEVTNVIVVRDGLWIVEFTSTQFITGFGDVVDSGAAYVSTDGFVGGRPDPTDNDPGCYRPNRTLNAEIEALAAEAAAADQ